MDLREIFFESQVKNPKFYWRKTRVFCKELRKKIRKDSAQGYEYRFLKSGEKKNGAPPHEWRGFCCETQTERPTVVGRFLFVMIFGEVFFMNQKLKALVLTALFAAISCVLFLVQFATPLTPPFLKLDLSDLPALLASLLLGPVYGVLVCLIKNVIGLFHSQTGGVGELSNFLLSAVFVLVAGLFAFRARRKGKALTLRGTLAGSVLGALAMALMSFPSNLFLVYPVYQKFMPLETIMGLYRVIAPGVRQLWQALLLFNVPFTFVKALLSVVFGVVLYRALSRFLAPQGGLTTER
jgi:riboflavin transporter FmnP